MDRTTADGALSDVSASEASSGIARPPYRRPPVQLPVPEASPTPGTTASTWFGPRVAAAQEVGTPEVAADDLPAGSAPAGPAPAGPAPAGPAPAGSAPEPAPPVGGGRTSYGFTAGPISPGRSASNMPTHLPRRSAVEDGAFRAGPWSGAPGSRAGATPGATPGAIPGAAIPGAAALGSAALGSAALGAAAFASGVAPGVGVQGDASGVDGAAALGRPAGLGGAAGFVGGSTSGVVGPAGAPGSNDGSGGAAGWGAGPGGAQGLGEASGPGGSAGLGGSGGARGSIAAGGAGGLGGIPGAGGGTSVGGVPGSGGDPGFGGAAGAAPGVREPGGNVGAAAWMLGTVEAVTSGEALPVRSHARAKGVREQRALPAAEEAGRRTAATGWDGSRAVPDAGSSSGSPWAFPPSTGTAGSGDLSSLSTGAPGETGRREESAAEERGQRSEPEGFGSAGRSGQRSEAGGFESAGRSGQPAEPGGFGASGQFGRGVEAGGWGTTGELARKAEPGGWGTTGEFARKAESGGLASTGEFARGAGSGWPDNSAARVDSGRTGGHRTVDGGQHGAGSARTGKGEKAPRARQPRLVTAGLVLMGVLVLTAGTVAGIVYFSGDDRGVGDSRLSTGAGPGADDSAQRTVSAPIGNRTTASFELLAGVSTVHVSMGDLGKDLYRISTPADAGIKPSPVLRGDEVQLQVARDGTGTGGQIEVVLSTAVRWDLRFSGYADDQQINLSGGKVSGVELTAGMHKAELELPQPSGTVPVTISGAVDQLALRSPADSPVRVRVGGGATDVVAGTRKLHDIAPGSTLTPKDWKQYKDRYDVTTASAIGSLNVSIAA